MTGEERAMKGICCDCDGSVKVYTKEEITEIKEDLGMSADDDFGDWCDDCFKRNTGMNKSDLPA